MERFSQGDNVLLGYRHPKSFENSENARYSNSDMDFNDVFGGPPRRYSMQEMRMRYSFSETIESEDDNPVFSTRGDLWSGLNEKPVFGEESVNRRRYVNDDFFDDIFKGDESYGSPRRTERDPFGSAPDSRVLSPARPLPPTAEPFGTSIPAQFSLPAKLTTAMDSPVFASGNGSPEKNKDGISNGMTNPQTSKASFSKFLNRAINGKSEARGDRQFYRQSPLSREVSLTSEESPHIIKSNEKDKGSKFKEDSESVDESQFHFSIYKWPGGGVPLMMPLRAGKSSKFEEKSKTERFSSSNDSSIKCNNFDNERSEYDNMDSEAASADNHSVSSNAESKSLEVEREKDEKGNKQEGTESHATIKDANLEVLESKLPNGIKNPAVPGKATLNNRTEELPSSHQAGIRDKLEKEVRTNVAQAAKREMKPLRALLSDNVDAQGNSNEEIESAVKGRAANSVHISNKEKKNDARRKIPNKESVDKDSLPGSPITSGNTPGKTGVKGKVTEFVKIFNQETTRKTKINADTRSQSSRWKSTDNYGIDSEGSTTIHKMDEKVQSSKVDNTPKAFCKVDENLYKNSVKQPSNIKTSNHTSSRYTDQKDASSNPESFRGIYKATSGNSEDHFQESFSVEVLCQDQDKGLQTNVNREEIQASDAKIQQWSHGRKGNIRSLLSTLQYVLWPESGWKPVPLVNIIEGSGVKRAYQRALLCLHPDKLQQKDASFHQKYIAEKVFDILQEAWDHFNSLGGI